MKYSIRKYEVTEVDYRRYVEGGGRIRSIEQLKDNVLAEISEFGGKENNEKVIAEYATYDEAKEAFEAYTNSPAEDKKPIIKKANVIGNKCDVTFYAVIESAETEDECNENFGVGDMIVNIIDDSHADFLYDCNICSYVKEEEEDDEEE